MTMIGCCCCCCCCCCIMCAAVAGRGPPVVDAPFADECAFESPPCAVGAATSGAEEVDGCDDASPLEEGALIRGCASKLEWKGRARGLCRSMRAPFEDNRCRRPEGPAGEKGNEEQAGNFFADEFFAFLFPQSHFPESEPDRLSGWRELSHSNSSVEPSVEASNACTVQNLSREIRSVAAQPWPHR